MAKARSGLRWDWVANNDVTQRKWAVLCQDQETTDVIDFNVPAKMVLANKIFEQEFRVLNLSSKSDPITGWNYINLAITKSFHVPLSDDLKVATFYSTNATAVWNELDLPKLEGATATEAIAAGLTGKIVLIGDSTQTFQQLGQTSPGPYIFRNPNGAVQITKSGSIFEVTPLQLQPLTQDVQRSGKTRIVYTVTSNIQPEDNDWILIDGPGNILLPAGPIDGFKFLLDDRLLYRLNENRNSIIASTGQTIALGQGVATLDHETPLTWVAADAGSFSEFIYDGLSKNWRVLLTRQGVTGGGVTQTETNPTIFTGATETIATPYDNLYLGGNGPIRIYALVSEGQFIDINWDAGAVYTVEVSCPLGTTILGKTENLTIETSKTAVTHLRITRKAGADYGVTS